MSSHKLEHMMTIYELIRGYFIVYFFWSPPYTHRSPMVTPYFPHELSPLYWIKSLYCIECLCTLDKAHAKLTHQVLKMQPGPRVINPLINWIGPRVYEVYSPAPSAWGFVQLMHWNNAVSSSTHWETSKWSRRGIVSVSRQDYRI